MSKKRKKYTTKFKQEAVNLVTEHGYSYAETGRSLDVNTSMLRRWHKELESGGKAALPGIGLLHSLF
jgi:transposase